MLHRESKSLSIAVRVYPEPKAAEADVRSRKRWQRPEAMLVFDPETRTDPTQSLTFGSYRFIVDGLCLEEGLFYGNDLPQHDLEIIENYVVTHRAETARGKGRQLGLLTLRQFLKRFYRYTYKTRCLLIGFNLPFDLSRIAYDVTDARGRFAGGFSLGLWSYVGKTGNEGANQYRPRIGIKHIDSKRALKGFTARKKPDKTDIIPEESIHGAPEKGYKFRGHFLDLRTLAFALTDRGYSLETACEAFGVEHGKQQAAHHGIVTEEYIDYNRRDVLATWELAVKLLEEYDKHPIALQATKAFSPASIGKAYLRAIGIKPVLERQPDFPKEYLGFAASAFFGGRTSAHIRKVPVPIVYTDFLSMYPTVNSLMGLWQFVIAEEIRVVEHCNTEIQTFLDRMSADSLFKPETWKHLTGFVKLVPDGDILPTRGKYSVETNDWQVAVNHLYSESDNPSHALWFSLPDVVVSVLLTGRVPKIIDAFRIEPIGTLSELEVTKLRGAIEVDPGCQDFFKVVIEERKRLSSRSDLSEVGKERLDKALKVLANATSYGIYAEMNRQELDNPVNVTCHGIDADPFTCRVAHPDVPGEYCFPLFAALITGAARLMLALLEYSVTRLGGTYAMEDTDSMAIVATKRGGLVPCPGGSLRMANGSAAIRALSWKHVKTISERFDALNPYDRDAVRDSILKIEDDNFDRETGNQRQVYCFAISAKRYALLLRDTEGVPVLLRKGVNNKSDRWSQHGLGHLLNPIDPENEDRKWTAAVWLGMARRALGLPTQPPTFENSPAVGRVTVSSPGILRSLADFNAGKKYCNQLKPFNFLLTCHVRPFGHPLEADPERFHLIAPYTSDPQQWREMLWIDQYSGKRYRITTTGHHGKRRTARVKTYGDVVREYEFHPESKCADAKGEPCKKQSIGLLQRRHVRIDQLKYIGKESNSLEDVESGLVHSERNLYTEYPDPRRDEWQTKTLPTLRKIPLPILEQKSGLSRRMLIYARSGRHIPRQENRVLLSEIVRRLATDLDR
jgi:hypothetical protein